MRFYRQGQQGELDWRRECERRMHAESAGQWIRLGHQFTAERLHGGEGTAAAARGRFRGQIARPARRIRPAASERLTARPGIAFSRDCGRTPRG